MSAVTNPSTPTKKGFNFETLSTYQYLNNYIPFPMLLVLNTLLAHYKIPMGVKII